MFCTTPIGKHLCFSSAWYFILKLLILLVSGICYLLLISMVCTISEAKRFSSIFCILISYQLSINSCSFYSADNKFLFTLKVFNVAAISPFLLRLQMFPLTLLFALNLFIFILDFYRDQSVKNFLSCHCLQISVLTCDCMFNYAFVFMLSEFCLNI